MRSQKQLAILVLVVYISSGSGFNTRTRSSEPDFRPAEEIEDKIVNGVVSEAHAYPWMVNILLYGNFHLCGGSLYNSMYVISAAHCFPKDFDLFSYSMVLGDYNQQQTETGQVTRKIKSIRTHPDFNQKTMNNDLVIVEMSEAVDYSDSIRPIGMTFFPVMAGETLTVMGWGASEGTMDEDILNEASVPVIDREVCNQTDWYDGKITENMICAGFAAGETDSCQGDSGGPLVRHVMGGQCLLQGVVSWGKGCADPRQPGVYTNLINYVDWIHENTH